MTDLADLARRLVEASGRGDPAALNDLLHADARLRVWGWQGAEAHRPRARVAQRLTEQWAASPGALLEVCTVTANAERAVVEFRVQLDDPATGRCVEHNHVLVATAEGDLLHTLDLYTTEPLPSAPRHPGPAPAD